MNEASQCENPSVSVSVQQRVDDVCVRFEAACQAGQRPRIEDYVSDVPDVERSLLLRELLKIDIAYRRRAGENPCLQDYRDRFPSLDLAFLSSTATSEAGREQTNDFAHPAAPPGGATHIRCPHCHNPIPRIDDQPDEVLCPGCGSSFRVREARQTTTMAAMRPLGKFQLLERVGLGAFGAVWRARDTELDRMVALKMPHTSLLTSEADLERFHREARAAGQLRHPGIVTVHEVRMLEGVPTIVSDFIEGVPLKNLLEVRRLTFREAATLVADVAAAMDYAHTMGLVHRDIKPANIMIEYGHAKDERPRASAAKAESERGSLGRPLVMDFGLALRQEAEITLTLDGHIVGTPAYMSPEQAAGKGHEADRRSDVYSLGVILYELLCGELPFRGSKTMMLHQVVHEEPRPPRRVNDKIPRDLETICLKAMAKAPGRRYPSGRALAEDLRRFLSGQPIEARPVGAWERCVKWMKRRPAAAALVAVSGLAALALVGVAVGLWYNGQLQDALNMAKEQGLEADKLRARAEAQELSVRYARDMHLAHQAWQQDKIGLVLEQLNNWRSPQEGQPDLRGWEWDYLYGLCHKDLFTLQGHADEVHSVAFKGYPETNRR